MAEKVVRALLGQRQGPPESTPLWAVDFFLSVPERILFTAGDPFFMFLSSGGREEPSRDMPHIACRILQTPSQSKTGCLTLVTNMSFEYCLGLLRRMDEVTRITIDLPPNAGG